MSPPRPILRGAALFEASIVASVVPCWVVTCADQCPWEDHALTYLIALLVVAILAGHHSELSLGSVEPASHKSGTRRLLPSRTAFMRCRLN